MERDPFFVLVFVNFQLDPQFDPGQVFFELVYFSRIFILLERWRKHRLLSLSRIRK